MGLTDFGKDVVRAGGIIALVVALLGSALLVRDEPITGATPEAYPTGEYGGTYAPDIVWGAVEPDPPAGVVTTNFHTVLEHAQANEMQLVTIPWSHSMNVTDDYGYLFVERDEEGQYGTRPDGSAIASNTEWHTFAISREGNDARTNVGCFEAWSFDGRLNDGSLPDGYGEAFCISDNDMLWLFNHGAYGLAYDGY